MDEKGLEFLIQLLDTLHSHLSKMMMLWTRDTSSVVLMKQTVLT